MKNVWLKYRKRIENEALLKRLYNFVELHAFEDVGLKMWEAFRREFPGHNVGIQITLDRFTREFTGTTFKVGDVSMWMTAPEGVNAP